MMNGNRVPRSPWLRVWYSTEARMAKRGNRSGETETATTGRQWRRGLVLLCRAVALRESSLSRSNKQGVKLMEIGLNPKRQQVRTRPEL